MARDTRRRRRTRISAGTCTGDREPPPTRTSIHDLPDDLLELILLRVRTPVCLSSAADTCKLWRHVIAGDGFLQSLRPRHRPNHLLGHYSVNTTWEQGSSSTVVEFVPCPEWEAVDLRQRLSLDFLVDGEYKNNKPELTDSRGGLVAFVLHDSWHVVVCDPWTRDYREVNFSWLRDMCLYEYDCLGAFILDAGNGDADSDDENRLMSSFSVLFVCLLRDLTDNTRTAEACVFSARDKDNNPWIRWTVSSNNFCTDVSNVDMGQRFVGRAGGSIFFSGIKTLDNTHVLLVLDEATGDFSTITLPLAPDRLVDDKEILRVASGGAAGTLVRIVYLVHDDLKVFKATRDQHGGWECMVEKSVNLCQAANIESRWVIINRPWRFLDTTMAAAKNRVLIAYSPRPTLLSLDLQTMKLQRANRTTTRMTLNANRDYRRVFPYQLAWPQKIN